MLNYYFLMRCSCRVGLSKTRDDETADYRFLARMIATSGPAIFGETLELHSRQTRTAALKAFRCPGLLVALV
jgi:hypothetical protein